MRMKVSAGFLIFCSIILSGLLLAIFIPSGSFIGLGHGEFVMKVYFESYLFFLFSTLYLTLKRFRARKTITANPWWYLLVLSPVFAFAVTQLADAWIMHLNR